MADCSNMQFENAHSNMRRTIIDDLIQAKALALLASEMILNLFFWAFLSSTNTS